MRLSVPLLAATLTAAVFAPDLLPRQNSELSRNRNYAEAQHEIVMILIKKKEYDKAADEANKIFQMKWPEDQESVLLKELISISDQFLHCDQKPIAVRVLDANLPTFHVAKNRASIWKEKGYLLEKMGEHDKALECFREAQRLEFVK
jgi:tetratricopeptide (TPR) repeat protein